MPTVKIMEIQFPTQSTQMAVERQGEIVCVTGASGFIGSWIVGLLLRRGYTVRATVRNLEDEAETQHLEAMEGADSRLHLFRMDLLDYNSIVAAVSGAAGVFHVASPCTVTRVADPQRELLAPATEGTVNVLTAAKEVGVRRVVITSSISAMALSPSKVADAVEDENCWPDEEYCKQAGLWYPLSKILAEKAAWKFAEDKDMSIVVVNPGTVLGPLPSPSINASMLLALRLLQGTEVPEDFFMGFVHVKDVALAHVLVYENTSAVGRYLCVESSSYFDDFAEKTAQLFPEYKVTRSSKGVQPGLPRTKYASKKLIDMGLEFTSLDQIVQDCILSLRNKGYLS